MSMQSERVVLESVVKGILDKNVEIETHKLMSDFQGAGSVLS